MKIRTMVLSSLVGVIILAMCYEASAAKSKSKKAGLKIGVVSIRKIFRDCKKTAKYREETLAERNKIEAELEKLAREIEADRAGLKTLKTGSSDYLELVKQTLTKQAGLQAQQKFYEQQIALKEQKIFEEIYKDILLETGKAAKQKGLDLVFEKSEPELPAPTANELTLTISTHKLLYSGGCLDITDEVMARVDASK